MCAFSSNSRGVMRQCDPANVVRELFGPKSQRNLSAASVLHIDEKTVGGREGFLTWLKDIFNKSVEDRSHEADTSIVTIDRAATTLDHPEITVSKRPADSSGKVDVVNQKLANFNTMQSITKFEDENFRIEKNNVKNKEKRANVIQTSTIYISSQSNKPEKNFKRETNSDFAWFDPGKIHRSERNMIKFAARDDVVVHYHHYTNPRHCYHLPPPIKQPLLECALNRNINVLTRAIANFASKNSKPPIREPNMPEKREKKDEKKDKKEKKKPVIHTDGEFVDSSENRAKMVADDNPKGNPETAFRYEWGVKLTEKPVAEASDNDNFAEKNRQYVTKQFWGVNLKQLKPDIENAPSSASEDLGRNAEEHRSTFPISERSDTIVDETRNNVSSSLNSSMKKPKASNLKGTMAEYLSTPSYQANLISSNDNSITSRQEKIDANSSLNSETFRRIMNTSLDVSKEPIAIDDEYNVPEGATEIIAWKNLAMRSKMVSRKEDYILPDNVENMEMVSIRSKAPQSKLDVQSTLKDQEIDRSDSGYKAVKSMDIKHFESSQKSDGYVTSKRLHTATSMKTRYAHRHISNIATFSINSILIDKITQVKYSKFASAFSTNSENSKKVIKTLNQQNKEEIDSESWNEEEKSNTNNSLGNKQSSLSSLELKTFSTNDQKPSNTDNLTETLNVVANQETEKSLNEQTVDKDEDVPDEIEYYKNSNASLDSHNKDTYIDFNIPTTDGDFIKSSNVKLSKEDSKTDKTKNNKNITLDTNVKNIENEYIIDGNYVRLPGDPYPYDRENLDKWHISGFKNFVYKSIKRETKFDSTSIVRSNLRNANDNLYANVTRDSHAGKIMKTSGSGDGKGAKNVKRSRSAYHVSSRNQRVVSDCLRGDAADALGLQRWTEAFSQLDGKMDETAMRGGDDASSRAYHQ